VLGADRDPLLDERDVTPAVRSQRTAVVVGLAGEPARLVGNVVPFLAGDLAGLAPDADRRVGEEALSGRSLLTV